MRRHDFVVSISTDVSSLTIDSNCVIISDAIIQYLYSRILKKTQKSSHVWCYAALCLMNLAVEACTVVRHRCFLQESATEHGCGVVLWFMTSEAPLTTNSLHYTASITKTEKYKYTMWHISTQRASVPLCAPTACRHHLFWPLAFSNSLRSWRIDEEANL